MHELSPLRVHTDLGTTTSSVVRYSEFKTKSSFFTILVNARVCKLPLVRFSSSNGYYSFFESHINMSRSLLNTKNLILIFDIKVGICTKP